MNAVFFIKPTESAIAQSRYCSAMRLFDSICFIEAQSFMQMIVLLKDLMRIPTTTKIVENTCRILIVEWKTCCRCFSFSTTGAVSLWNFNQLQCSSGIKLYTNKGVNKKSENLFYKPGILLYYCHITADPIQNYKWSTL